MSHIGPQKAGINTFRSNLKIDLLVTAAPKTYLLITAGPKGQFFVPFKGAPYSIFNTIDLLVLWYQMVNLLYFLSSPNSPDVLTG